MFKSRAQSQDGVRRSFADQFERNGNGFVYRRSQKGEAIRVSAEERRRFIDEFDRNMSLALWIIFAGLFLVIGGIVGFALSKGSDFPQAAMYIGIAVVMVPYFIYYRWSWLAPSRALQGRTPIAGERPTDEVRRLRFQRITYGNLALAAAVGIAIPCVEAARYDVLSGWGRLWLVFGGGLVAMAAVQAFRKWQFGKEHPAAYAVPQAYQRETEDQPEDKSPPKTAKLWRYAPLALIVIGFAFVAYTESGKQLAKAPAFWPVVISAFGAWSLFTVFQGLRTGEIEPIARGFYNTYRRETQPKRFWASMSWNASLGCLMFWLALTALRDARAEAVQDNCYNEHDKLSMREAFEACTDLIEGRARLTNLTMAEVYAYRAYADERLGDRRRALADYTQAIRLDPTDIESIINRGTMLVQDRKYDKAVADFSRAHELKPKSPWPLAYRGLAHLFLKRPAQARSDFEIVERVDPANPVMLRGRAMESIDADDIAGAEHYLTASLKSDPNNRWALRMRSWVYRQLGDFERAEADKRKFEQLRRAPK